MVLPSGVFLFLSDTKSIVITSVRAFDDPVLGNAAFALVRGVYLVMVDDGTARLVNLDSFFYSLSESATTMLLGVLDGSVDEAAQSIARCYAVDLERVRMDLDTFCTNLRMRNLIQPTGVPRNSVGLRALIFQPLVKSSLVFARSLVDQTRFQPTLLLSLAYISIRLLGWSDTIKVWHDCYSGSEDTGIEADAKNRAEAIDHAVREATARHPLNITCKERALCCWALMRGEKISARLTVGVDLFPLASHCWCQLASQTLSDYEDRCERFTPIVSYH